jgi:aryl carrier-like protein
LRLAPPGATGHVYIGGDQLARGYRRRPAVTAERFVPDPFRGSGGRLYRTGDLGRYTADQRIQIIGREDAEVKVRGFRVNSSEVEAVLQLYPGVERVVVVADGDEGDQRLAAFISWQPAVPPEDPAALRRYVAQHLPPHMVPFRIDHVTSFPLLHNGKIDRVALAREGRLQPASATGVSTLSEAERVVADIWMHVLNVSSVAPDDDFFAMGGDSLTAMRFILHAEAQGIVVTFEQLLDAPTLGALGCFVAAQLRRDGGG